MKSEPDYTKFIQKGSPVASPLGLRTGAVEGSAEAHEDGGIKVNRSRGSGQGNRHGTHVGIQEGQNRGEKLADATSPSTSLTSLSSSHQMKIISVLVSIAGIFCILLLFIIAALKCGLLDSQCEQETIKGFRFLLIVFFYANEYQHHHIVRGSN